MSIEKTIDISVLPEAEQDLIKALFDKCCERVNQKVAEVKQRNTQKPKYGDEYYYIGTDGYIYIEQWKDRSFDEIRWELGNVFLTEEKAEFAREKQKVKMELQRYADEHNDPEKEEWDGENEHYRIGYDIDADDFITTSGWNIIRDDVYFTSKEIAEDAANKVGAKRIMKYLFDVDCEVDE